jgi:hypothetical protein
MHNRYESCNDLAFGKGLALIHGLVIPDSQGGEYLSTDTHLAVPATIGTGEGCDISTE